MASIISTNNSASMSQSCGAISTSLRPWTKSWASRWKRKNETALVCRSRCLWTGRKHGRLTLMSWLRELVAPTRPQLRAERTYTMRPDWSTEEEEEGDAGKLHAHREPESDLP